MAQIAEHAGVGIGTVYRHFATREELLGALVHRSFGLALDNARVAAAHPGPPWKASGCSSSPPCATVSASCSPCTAARSSSPLPPASAKLTFAPPCAT